MQIMLNALFTMIGDFKAWQIQKSMRVEFVTSSAHSCCTSSFLLNSFFPTMFVRRVHKVSREFMDSWKEQHFVENLWFLLVVCTVKHPVELWSVNYLKQLLPFWLPQDAERSLQFFCAKNRRQQHLLALFHNSIFLHLNWSFLALFFFTP